MTPPWWADVLFAVIMGGLLLWHLFRPAPIAVEVLDAIQRAVPAL